MVCCTIFAVDVTVDVTIGFFVVTIFGIFTIFFGVTFFVIFFVTFGFTTLDFIISSGSTSIGDIVSIGGGGGSWGGLLVLTGMERPPRCGFG